jgi:two-component system, NarL family, sensor histidine kinase UhpB
MPIDFPSLFNAVPGCFLVLAPDYPVFTILAATNDYLRVTKTTRSEIMGRPLFEVFPDNPGDPATQATHNTCASLTRAIELRVPDLMPVQRHDIRLEGGEFEERYWSPVNSPVVNDKGEVAYLIHQVENVTDSVLLKQKNSYEFRLLTESLPQIFWICAPDGMNIYFNQLWVDYTGMTLEESYGHGWNKPFHPDDQQRAMEAWQNATSNGAVYALECRLRRKDGVYKWWQIHGVPVPDKRGRVVKWFGTCTDIHELKEAEERLRRYARRLIEMEENLREKVSLELHDDIGQELTALSLNLAHIAKKLPHDSQSNLQSTLVDSRELTKAISVSVRELMAELRPSQLGEYGLASALRSYGELYGQRAGLAVAVQVDLQFPRMTAEQETVLFRIAQEALNNIAKYACATCVTISLGCSAASVYLSIVDDGKGFQQQAGTVQPPGSGWGLTIMRERAALVGGSFRLVTAPGEGTAVTIEIMKAL